MSSSYRQEQNELVKSLKFNYMKKRLKIVNAILFLSNVVLLIFLIIGNYSRLEILGLVFPIFVLNLIIFYSYEVSNEEIEHLYLGMYVSIFGIISVVNNIFLVELTLNTYILTYFAVFVISIYRDKRAVLTGYVLLFSFATINHFKYQQYLQTSSNDLIQLVPYVYEIVLFLLILMEIVRTWLNDNELLNLYNELELSKKLELTYQDEIIKNVRHFDKFNNDILNENNERVQKYIELFSSKFDLENIDEKISIYYKLQSDEGISEVKTLMKKNYQLRQEYKQLESISLYKNSSLKSFIMSLKAKVLDKDLSSKIDYEFVLGGSNLTIENKILGFIILYESLLHKNSYLIPLNHEEIVKIMEEKRTKELIDKNIINFFLENDEKFLLIHAQENIE